jgi:predicted metal-dependent phosphoesterase TrpH
MPMEPELSGGLEETIGLLGAPDRERRLEAAATLGAHIASGDLPRKTTAEINNHVHTMYSFSPYSPAAAAFEAWRAGLMTVGAMDHDSVAGCEEMLDAAESIGIASTVGFELRVNMDDTAMAGRKINNPDSENIVYMAVHGIPRRSIEAAKEFLEPVQNARNERNREMVNRLSSLAESWGLGSVDFERDVYSRSRAIEGGSITERHILFALSEILVDRVGKGSAVLSFLKEKTGLVVPAKLARYLSDTGNPHYLYDLLGVFKGSLINEIYIQPDNSECVSVGGALKFSDSIDAISAYAYLGDVGESPTGDKKAQKFEDDYLDELFTELDNLGFRAITYMPPRNTREQLARVQRLCRSFGFMEISGVDINSSRQEFNCPEVVLPEFFHLTRAAWALIAHEKLADTDQKLGLFHPKNPIALQPIEARIETYAKIGEAMDPGNIESIRGIAVREFS